MSSTHAMAILLEGLKLSNAPDWDSASSDFLPPNLMSTFFEKSHKSLNLNLFLVSHMCLINMSATPFIAPSPYSISLFLLTTKPLLL